MNDFSLNLTPASTCTPELSDAEFLRGLEWRKSAAQRLVSAARKGDVEEFVARLSWPRRRPSVSRKNPTLSPLLYPLWSRFAFDPTPQVEPTVELLVSVDRFHQKHRAGAPLPGRLSKRVDAWLETSERLPVDPFQMLAGLTLLQEVARRLKPQTLFRLWRVTLTGALQIGTALSGAASGLDATFDQRLLIQGELAWRAGLLFGDLRGSGKRLRAGRDYHRDMLEDSTDTDGTPHARYLERLSLSIAAYVRSTDAGELFGRPLWNRRSNDRFHGLVERAAALCQPDGRLALSNGASLAPVSLLRTASVLAGLNSREAAVQRLMLLPDDTPLESPGNSRPRKHRPRQNRAKIAKAERPSSQSDWAELICLRNNWLRGSDSCVITHDQLDARISLTAFDIPLLDGCCPTETRVGETPVEPDAPWECVCWFSDKDADYVELQRACQNDVVLLRQILLSGNDHLLYLADTVTTTGSHPITHSLRLPLAKDTLAKQGTLTRDVTLSQARLRARVVPLSLEPHRVIQTGGRLWAEDRDLVLEQTAIGSGVHLPLVIDWSPERRRDAAGWRRLTVAEQGAPVGPDRACGYRLKIGAHQWIFYHSLTPPRVPRTVIGQHMAYETLIGEFQREGNVAPLVMVE